MSFDPEEIRKEAKPALEALRAKSSEQADKLSKLLEFAIAVAAEKEHLVEQLKQQRLTGLLALTEVVGYLRNDETPGELMEYLMSARDALRE